MDNEIIKQGEELVEKLLEVKKGYNKSQEELKRSIRREVVAVELKDILLTNSDFNNLKGAIENYIQKLLEV